MKVHNTYIWLIIGVTMVLSSCKNFLDIVPDNVATIDYAFRNRTQAEKYLFTCYNNLPNWGNLSSNIGLLGSDELVTNYPGAQNFSDISVLQVPILWGLQNKVNPYSNYWSGRNGGKAYFQAIRECNIFLENIDETTKVDLTVSEKDRWVAEVKFLKAYYHYYLLRMYGPIPMIKTNLPISAGIDEVRVYRDPVDSVFNYVVSLIDEATPSLPEVLMNEGTELGRITKTVALAVKAEILATAASPLFNGNIDYASFIDSRGVNLFSTTYSEEKWELAHKAAAEAIEMAHKNGNKLYKFQQRIATYKLSDTTYYQMNLRGAITDRWNSEILWGSLYSSAGATGRTLQSNAQAFLSPVGPNTNVGQNLAVNMNFADLFYSARGVPVEEDKTYDYNNRFSKLKVGDDDNRFNIKKGYTTSAFNYDREHRFYASLGFDGGIWYGSGMLNDATAYYVEAKLGQTAGNGTTTNFSVTGYWPKKLVHYNNTYAANNVWTGESYPWPVMRLAELYLLYAETANEANGPSEDAYKYIDSVRMRSGLEGVVDSWAKYSNNPNKPHTKSGLRDIIQRERMLEVAFEGKRFWDIRRWKVASLYLNKPILGWQITQTTAVNYYNVRTIHNPFFSSRDYFWPISENDIAQNPNLVQNPGW